MARITVEDCIEKFPSRFELVLVASQRARKLHSGDDPTVERDNDKNTVIALREIADTAITVEAMKETLIQEYQTITISDEEEENQEIESLETGTNITELNQDGIEEDIIPVDAVNKLEANIDIKELKKDDSQEDSSSVDAGSEIEKEMKDLIVAEEEELEEQYEITDSSEIENSSSEVEKEEKEQDL